MSTIHSIAEIVLWVHDLNTSLQFYRETLGLEKISPPEMKAPVFLKVGEGAAGVPQMIVLVPLPADAPHHIVVNEWNGEAVRGSASETRLQSLDFTRAPSGMEKWNM